MEIHALREMYAGRSCFLICDGPSFKKVDKHKLMTPGLITVGVNNAPASFRTDLWLFADSPEKFLESLKADPRILKITRRSKQNHLQPPKVAIDLNTSFNADTYLAESSVSFGSKGNVRSIMLVALKTLYLLGFRNVYLLGVDFEMIEDEENYHFAQETSPRHVRGNNRAYQVLTERFEALKPHFDEAGFQIWNCNPDSKLDVFPFAELDDAIIASCENMPDPATESTEGMYERRKVEPPRIMRRATRTTRGDRLKVICVLKTGGDFDIDDVANLRRHVAAGFAGIDYEFVCYSDNPAIADRKLKCNFKGWWSKLEIFRETGPCIYFDLDIGLLQDLAPLADWVKQGGRRFAMIEEWLDSWKHMWNSSVMAWNGDYSYLLQEYYQRADEVRYKRGGDQEYTTNQLRGHNERVEMVSNLLKVYSFKFHCRDGVPEDARILCFHGKPRPRSIGAPYWIHPEEKPEIDGSAQDVFRRFYKTNRWGSRESSSGKGSEQKTTRVIAEEIPDLMRRREFGTLLDLPCGDFNWMRAVNLDGFEYIGGDIVPAIIERNKLKYDRRFQVLDVATSDLPESDLVLCRDCLVHLPNEMIQQALDNLRRNGVRWLLATAYPGSRNVDIKLGGWRRLDMAAKPFDLPEVEILDEQAEGGDKGKVLALYDLTLIG